MEPTAGVGILLRTLAVLDADSPEEVKRWESEWPVLHLVPMETTSKGRHYFFERTPLCDELGLTDGLAKKVHPLLTSTSMRTTISTCTHCI